MPKATEICSLLTYFAEQGLGRKTSIFKPQTPVCKMVLYIYGLPKWNILVPILWSHPFPAPCEPILMHLWNIKQSFTCPTYPDYSSSVNTRLCGLYSRKVKKKKSLSTLYLSIKENYTGRYLCRELQHNIPPVPYLKVNVEPEWNLYGSNLPGPWITTHFNIL